MLFNSAPFIVFFPVVILAFFSLPRRFQWIVLLLASAYFYMSFVPWYILILLFLITVDYSAGRLIEQVPSNRRKLCLIVSIIANLGVLFVFKYFNFFNENIAALAEWIDWNYSIESLKLILPIGLSFHVFQSLSYVIEVYRKNFKAERHIGVYALYVLFFPQLVAGPIERPQNLLPQLHLGHFFNYERIMDGLTLMLWGFFKKLVIADQVAIIVDHVYGNLYSMPPAALVIAMIFFSYQIYCDFSGYTDIARGAARVLGFNLMLNFNRPYASRSIAEFWRRWHISLSSWIRDYVYIPLGGNRVSKLRHAENLIFTFLLCGLWHGANWTFIVWGALHGVYLVFGALTRSLRMRFVAFLGMAKIPCVLHLFQVLITFVLVSLGWVFFRAATIHDAWSIIERLPEGFLQLLDMKFMYEEVLVASLLGTGAMFILLRIAAIAFMEIVEYITRDASSLRSTLMGWPFSARVTAYYVFILWIFLLGYFDTKSFIYFQF